jgi:hypothetical protein
MVVGLLSRFEEDLIVLQRQAAEYRRTVYASLIGPRDRSDSSATKGYRSRSWPRTSGSPVRRSW